MKLLIVDDHPVMRFGVRQLVTQRRLEQPTLTQHRERQQVDDIAARGGRREPRLSGGPLVALDRGMKTQLHG